MFTGLKKKKIIIIRETRAVVVSVGGETVSRLKTSWPEFKIKISVSGEKQGHQKDLPIC